MSEKVTIALNIDSTDADTELSTLQERIDAQVDDWRIKRQMIINQLQEINRGISLVMQSVRMAVRVTGGALDPIQSALLALIGSTTSIIITTAVALAMSSFGLLIGVSLALAAFAYGMNLSQTAKVIADFIAVQERFASVEAQIDNAISRQIPRIG